MLTLWSDDPATVRLWSLTDDALVEDADEPGRLLVVTRWGEELLEPGEAVAAESLRRMAYGPVALRNALPPAEGGEPDAGAVRTVERLLDRLGGAVVHSLALPDGQAPLLSVVPLVAAPVFRPRPVPPQTRLRLSRFAALRPDGGLLVLEVPGAPFRVLLLQPLACALVTALVEPATTAGLAAAAEIPQPVVEEVLAFLVAAGTVLTGDGDGVFAEDTDADRRGWAQHELQFHMRSRSRPSGGGPAPVGAPPPVTRPLPAGPRFPLHRPDLDAVRAADPPLTDLLESDHVCPRLGAGGLVAEQVGELLYRSARIRSTGPAYLPSAAGVPPHEASQRPYSGVAGLHELEVFITLDRCAGLPRGVFHYDPLDHALTLVEDDPVQLGRLLDVGRIGAGSTLRPAAVVTVVARLGRVSWILPGGSYTLALQHCGAFQETLRLVAATLGLAVHAVPSDAHGVDEVLGLDWPAEVGLGESVVDVVPS